MGGSEPEAWRRAGQHVRVRDASGAERSLFVRDVQGGLIDRGDAAEPNAPLLFVHGFPTSSFDWAGVDSWLAGAAPDRRRVFVDLLGFGDSDKPRDHKYSFAEQLNLVAQALRKLSMPEMHLVVHDYGCSVAQEWLAQEGEQPGRLPALRSITWLNGGLFPGHYKPILIQRLLRSSLVGPALARVVGFRAFAKNMKKIAGASAQLDDDFLRDAYEFLGQGGGRHVLHSLSGYHDERAREAQRWQRAMSTTRVPLHFVWGLSDPISGTMPREIRLVCPDASMRTWPDVGHYPQWEVPELVGAQILQHVQRAAGQPSPSRPT